METGRKVRKTVIWRLRGQRQRRQEEESNIRKRENRPGIALVWTAIVLTVMIGIVGLSIDWGKLVWNVNQMQNAGDAAALAGAMVVKFDPAGARTRALAFAYANRAENLPVSLVDNPGNDPGGDVVLGRWIRQNRVFFPTLDTPGAVKVVVRRQGPRDGANLAPALSLLFGPAFGTQSVSAARESIAWCFDASGAGLILLSGTANPGLLFNGNCTLDVQNGGIQVNSGVEEAAKYSRGSGNGSCEIDCGQLNVVGTVQGGETSWDARMIQPFPINTGVDPVPDPLPPGPGMEGKDYRDIPLGSDGKPLYGTMRVGTTDTVPVLGTINSSCTLGPGYYPGGIDLKGDVVLDPTLGWDASKGPPIYYLGGVGLQGRGKGSLTGDAVTVYITNDKTARLDLGGNIAVSLTSPADYAHTDANGLPGIALWQDSRNTNDVNISGCSGNGVAGTMYFPTARVYANGTPGKGATQIIAGSMDITGIVNVGVNYDGRNDLHRSATAYLVK